MAVAGGDCGGCGAGGVVAVLLDARGSGLLAELAIDTQLFTRPNVRAGVVWPGSFA